MDRKQKLLVNRVFRCSANTLKRTADKRRPGSFMNYVDFGMNLEEALYAASVHSVRFPSYFYTAPWRWCGRSYESLMTACLNLASGIISSIFAGNGEKVREVDGLQGGGYLFGQLYGIMKIQYGHCGRHDYVPGK